jgi:hypothetical protein
MAQYADIISITPSLTEAPYGTQVGVSVKVKNKHSAALSVMVVAFLDLPGVNYLMGLGPHEQIREIAAGAYQSFAGSFTMPNQDVNVVAYSYWLGTDGSLHADDDMTIEVKLASIGSSQFGAITITNYAKV